MTTSRAQHLELWGYVVEIIGATAVVALLVLLFGAAGIAKFFHAVVGDFAAYVATVILAAGFAMLGVLFSKTDSAFGAWLHDRGAFRVFSRAYLLAILLGFASLLGLLACKNSLFNFSGVIGIWFLIYTAINGYTLARNSYDLIMLNLEFNKRVRR